MGMRSRLIRVELAIALSLGALGDWWAASAMRRLDGQSGVQDDK